MTGGSCPNCLQGYDPHLRVPMISTSCGHSVCRRCADLILGNPISTSPTGKESAVESHEEDDDVDTLSSSATFSSGGVGGCPTCHVIVAGFVKNYEAINAMEHAASVARAASVISGGSRGWAGGDDVMGMMKKSRVDIQDQLNLNGRDNVGGGGKIEGNTLKGTVVEQTVAEIDMMIARSRLKLVKSPNYVLGAGQAGVVYKGFCDGSEVAIKCVSSTSAAIAAQSESLLRELRLASRLRNANIVQFLGATWDAENGSAISDASGKQKRSLLLVSEYMAGGTLREALDTIHGGGLAIESFLDVATQVARGVVYLHAEGLAHRDLKSANILLSEPISPLTTKFGRNVRAKIADFGLSKHTNADAIQQSVEAGKLEATYAYLAPEAFGGNNANVINLDDEDEAFHNDMARKRDIYAMGVLFWEMLSGGQPWKGTSLPDVYVRVCVRGDRPFPALDDERIPGSIRRLVERCWSQDPLRRPSASAIAAKLAKIRARLIKEKDSSTITAVTAHTHNTMDPTTIQNAFTDPDAGEADAVPPVIGEPVTGPVAVLTRKTSIRTPKHTKSNKSTKSKRSSEDMDLSPPARSLTPPDRPRNSSELDEMEARRGAILTRMRHQTPENVAILADRPRVLPRERSEPGFLDNAVVSRTRSLGGISSRPVSPAPNGELIRTINNSSHGSLPFHQAKDKNEDKSLADLHHTATFAGTSSGDILSGYHRNGTTGRNSVHTRFGRVNSVVERGVGSTARVLPQRNFSETQLERFDEPGPTEPVVIGEGTSAVQREVYNKAKTLSSEDLISKLKQVRDTLPRSLAAMALAALTSTAHAKDENVLRQASATLHKLTLPSTAPSITSTAAYRHSSIIAAKDQLAVRKYLRSNGGIAALLALLSAPTVHSAPTLSYALLTIGNVIAWDLDAHKQFRERSGVPIVSNAMNIYATHLGMQEKGCYALACAAAGYPASKKSEFTKGGAIDAAVRALKTGRNSEHRDAVIKQACAALGSMSVGNKENAAQAGQSQAVKYLIAAFDHFRKASKTEGSKRQEMRLVCRAFMDIMCFDENVKDAGNFGGVALLIRAMRFFRLDSDFVEKAVATLGTFCTFSANIRRIVETNGVEDVAAAMVRFNMSVAMQREGSRVVRLIMTGNGDEARRRLVQAGGAEAILFALDRFGTVNVHQALAIEGCKALSTLCEMENRSEAEILGRRLKKMRAERTIKQVLQGQRSSASVQKEGKNTIALIGNLKAKGFFRNLRKRFRRDR